MTGAASPDVCLVWLGIPYASQHDSAETVQAVRENNAKRDSYCKGKQP